MSLRARLTGHRRRPQDIWACEPSHLDWLKYRYWQKGHEAKHRRAK